MVKTMVLNMVVTWKVEHIVSIAFKFIFKDQEAFSNVAGFCLISFRHLPFSVDLVFITP